MHAMSLYSGFHSTSWKKFENLVYEIKKNKADKSSIKKAQHFIEDSINSLVVNEESKKNFQNLIDTPDVPVEIKIRANKFIEIIN